MQESTLITSKDPATRGQMKQIGTLCEEALDEQGFLKVQLDFATRTGGELQRRFRQFLREYTLPAIYQPFDLAGALALLGKVILPNQNAQTFSRPPVATGQIIVCPSMDQIQQSVAQNQAGKHN